MKLAWILGTALSFTAAAACAPVDDTAETEQDTLGSASLAISAIGPDGHRYRLLSGTTFVANTPEGESAFSYPLFDGMDRQTIEFEVGSYVAELEGPGAGEGTIMLLRENVDGSNPSIVTARQVGPSPLPFMIRAGQTTQLTFRFAVPELGDVVFSAGAVDVGIDVESEQEPSQGTTFYANGSMTVSEVFTDSLAVPGLQQLADSLIPGDAVTANLGFFRTGDWELRPEGFCAPMQIGSMGGSGSEPEFYSFLVQVLSSSGSLCFIRESAGGMMLFNLGREGAPYEFQPDLGLPSPINIQVEGYGDPGEALVEGGVLHLSRLDDPLTLASAGITITMSAGGTNIATVVLAGSSTLSAVP